MNKRDLLAEAMQCTTDEERRDWFILLPDEERAEFYQNITDFVNRGWSAIQPWLVSAARAVQQIAEAYMPILEELQGSEPIRNPGNHN